MIAHCVSRALATVAALAVLAGCAETQLNEAPIVDRTAAPRSAPPAAVPPASREAHDGSYMVQKGDTLYSIALAFGQDYRDIARWSGLEDPTRLAVGRLLRVAPPSADAAAASSTAASTGTAPAADAGEVTATPIAAVASPETHQLDNGTQDAMPPPPTGAPAIAAVKPQTDAGAAPAVQEPQRAGAGTAGGAALAEPAGGWSWPVSGRIIERFDATRNKGIDIEGTAGDAVLAANDGQVVYCGSGLRGYGNLVIIKHTDDFVSAYAHNRQIVVVQGAAVKRGQRIAELGATDAPGPRLHFEIRRKGKPVDPLEYLPVR